MDCPSCHHPNVEGARFCASCGALLPIESTATDDPLLGQIVGGRYRITQLLGEGGMGRVYVAEQQMGTNVRKVAVKTLQAQYAKDPQVLARFHRECGTVSELEHPNTIQFFDFGQTPTGELYIAMEFVQGQSLADALVQGGAMSPERVVKIMQQICGSLEEAHSRGVIHRDLKPDNVILTTRAGQVDFVKVLDFGIAKRSEAKDAAQEQKLTKQGMVLGTPPYMSPEQFTGRELDARSDIYSLGVMTYEMLTGRLPFEADTPWQWATQHMTAQPFPFEAIPVSSSIPPAMKAAILRALSKSPGERQSNVRQFFDELAASASVTLGAMPVASAPAANRSGTAAMPFPPSFGSDPSSPGMAAPGMAAPGYPPSPTATPVTTLGGGQSLPIHPTPQASAGGSPRGGSSNKGLVMGLAGAAGLLAIIGLVLAARGMHSNNDGPLSAPIATATAFAPQAVSVAIVPPPPAPPAKPAEEPEESKTTAKHPAATPPPPAPAPTLKGEPACAEAKRLAQAQDVAGAVRTYAGCEGPSAAAAKTAIARSAPQAVQRKIFNGDCPGAKALASAVASLGGGSEAMSTYDKAPQCKK